MASLLRIVLSDDHALFRLGLKRILEGIPGTTVIGEAGDGFELLNLLKKLRPDLVLLDISMPRLRGLEAIPEIKALHPAMKIVILTMHKRKEYLREAIAAGAAGYLLKEDAGAELATAIDRVRKGKTYVSPLIAEELTDEWAQFSRGELQPDFKGVSLTLREREVLKLIAEGKSSKEIADLLTISARTAEHHRANIMMKLHANKTADLVKYACSHGYVN